MSLPLNFEVEIYPAASRSDTPLYRIGALKVCQGGVSGLSRERFRSVKGAFQVSVMGAFQVCQGSVSGLS